MNSHSVRLADRYELSHIIGTGGMARVYAAHDLLLDRPVAVKVIEQAEPFTESERQAFLAEARTVARLNHPHVVAIHDAGVLANLAYLVMELLDGGTLRDRLQAGPLPVREAQGIAAGLAQALDAAHGEGFLHLDVKPENILFGRDGRPKLADFGISRALDAEAQPPASTVVGTPAYLSPEALSGEPLDARADLYALGVVLYEMLTGRWPFIGESAMEVAAQRLTAQPEPPHRINPNVPPGLGALVLKALARHPADRFVSPGAMAQALLNFQATTTHPTRIIPALAGRSPAPPEAAPERPRAIIAGSPQPSAGARGSAAMRAGWSTFRHSVRLPSRLSAAGAMAGLRETWRWRGPRAFLLPLLALLLMTLVVLGIAHTRNRALALGSQAPRPATTEQRGSGEDNVIASEEEQSGDDAAATEEERGGGNDGPSTERLAVADDGRPDLPRSQPSRRTSPNTGSNPRADRPVLFLPIMQAAPMADGGATAQTGEAQDPAREKPEPPALGTNDKLFKAQTRAYGVLDVTIREMAPNIDYDLYVYDEAGKELGRSTARGTAPEQVKLTVPVGTYLLRAHYFEGPPDKPYNLRWTLTPTAPP